MVKAQFSRISIKYYLLASVILPIILVANNGVSSRVLWDKAHYSVQRSVYTGIYDHLHDQTVLVTMGPNSDPYVLGIDHSNGKHTTYGPYKITSQPKQSRYNYPSIGLLPSGEYVVCYPYSHPDRIGFAISKPNEITTWDHKMIPTINDENYPHILVDGRGYIYIFYSARPNREAQHYRPYQYIVSKDKGATWSEPVWCLHRAIDEPYGLCEFYVGQVTKGPHISGKPNLFWFAYTASGGFEYEGTHTGPDNSPYLIDKTRANPSNKWAVASYDWLYNTTKQTNGDILKGTTGIQVNTSTSMYWDIGDRYGIAYHNIYHSHWYVLGFDPISGNWYDAAGNNLGARVEMEEMDTYYARPYATPNPPRSKDIMMNPPMVVNDEGNPAALYYKKGHHTYGWVWNSNAWDTIITPIPSRSEYVYFADGLYTILTDGPGIFTSVDATNYVNKGFCALPKRTGRVNTNLSVIYEGHAEAVMHMYESKKGHDGTWWSISYGETQQPQALVLRCDNPVNTSTYTVRAYICEKKYGTRARVRDADNRVTLLVVSGNAHVDQSTVIATNGMAVFKVMKNNGSHGRIEIKATSDGLEPYSMYVY